MVTGVPPGDVIICHWDNGENTYEAIQIPIPALSGHTQHPEDIIPPVEGVLEQGQNWTVLGQSLWENGCELPDTGGAPWLLLVVAIAVLVAGMTLATAGGQRSR